MKTKFFFASLAAAAGMLISCNKEMIPSVQDTDETTPMTKAYGDKTPVVTAYIETNDTNPLNAGDYFDENGEPFFDIVELFASNIHKETVNGQVRPTLYLNDKLTPVLEGTGVTTYVRPLQEVGIKVLLTVLGDWQGVGVANMTDTQAEQFAEILAYAVEKYGLDGIGFDDEYANYSGSLVSGSFGNIITKLHAKLPADKLITVFAYGYTNQINSAAGALIDYAYTNFTYWNGTPGISGVTKDRWAPIALNLGNTYSSSALNIIRSNSKKAKDEGYGAIMTFNLRRSSEVDPMPVLQAISDGIGCGELSCDNGNRARTAGSVSTGYTLTYSEATGN